MLPYQSMLVERGALHATVRPEPVEGFDGLKCSTTTGVAVGPFAALRASGYFSAEVNRKFRAHQTVAK
ncbi:MAG: hypothetical protein H7203_03675 [Rhizobacter sp.]|nr:hypothetical protein [Burkholderiales bacterium]